MQVVPGIALPRALGQASLFDWSDMPEFYLN